MKNELDEVTPLDLYYGRMIRKFLEKEMTITVNHHGITVNDIRFTIDKGDWSRRVCLAKSIRDIELVDSVPSMADYDAANLLRLFEDENRT